MDNYEIILIVVLTHLTGLWIGYQTGKEEVADWKVKYYDLLRALRRDSR